MQRDNSALATTMSAMSAAANEAGVIERASTKTPLPRK
jgi:hypothetical protein